jgi:hypothetical protein
MPAGAAPRRDSLQAVPRSFVDTDWLLGTLCSESITMNSLAPALMGQAYTLQLFRNSGKIASWSFFPEKVSVPPSIYWTSTLSRRRQDHQSLSLKSRSELIMGLGRQTGPGLGRRFALCYRGLVAVSSATAQPQLRPDRQPDEPGPPEIQRRRIGPQEVHRSPAA